MSIQAVAWALDQDLPARPKLVLVSIANHANHTDGYCWLKAETIAAEASCSPRAVFNFVGDLIRNGFIRKEQRRADDGRQRSNDYWILFNREARPWQARGTSDAETDADGPEMPTADDAEAQDVDEPDARRACGDEAPEPVENPVQPAPRSCGPHASTCSHTDSAEPSKTNPENGGLPTGPPRRYRPPPPPPPQPMGSTTGDGVGPPIFVFCGTPAYEAWQRFKRRESGRPWALKTSRDGRFGWYFPTLFPPETGPPEQEEKPGTTEEESADYAKTG